MDINAQELRTIRYRMNWTQFELAQLLGCSVSDLCDWEHGKQPCSLSAQEESRLLIFQAQADSNSAQVQLRAVADDLMATRGLAQIDDTEVMECLRNGELADVNFR